MVFNLFTRWLVWILVMQLFVCVVTGGKDKRSVRKRPPAHSENTRSLQDWLKLSKEALRLACNAINIDSTGSEAVLAHSLFDNNRLDSDQQVATSSSSSDHQSPIVVAFSRIIQYLLRSQSLTSEHFYELRYNRFCQLLPLILCRLLFKYRPFNRSRLFRSIRSSNHNN